MKVSTLLFWIVGGAALALVAVTMPGCVSQTGEKAPAPSKQESKASTKAKETPPAKETASVEKPAAKAPPPPPKSWSAPPKPAPRPKMKKEAAKAAAEEIKAEVAARPQSNAPAPSWSPASKAATYYLTGVEFLLTDQKEDHGYGLFSYLVLTARPVGDLERERVKALYRMYCSNFSKAAALVSRGVDKKTINCTFWPLAVHSRDSGVPPGRERKCTYLSLKLSYPQSKEAITRAEECAVDLYDYGRAQVWLNKAEIPVDNGPYIVSSFVPLEELIRKEGAPPMLIMDLTKIHRDQFKEVMMFFRSQVCERPDTWKNYDWDVEWIKMEGLSALHQHAHSAIKFWEWMSGQVSVKSAYAETTR